jgi:hypothetical protein
MASTIKVDTITTPDGTGNISVDRPLSGSGAGLTSLPAANLTGALPAISGASLTGLSAGAWAVKSSGTFSSTSELVITSVTKTIKAYLSFVPSANTNINMLTSTDGGSGWGGVPYYDVATICGQHGSNTLVYDKTNNSGLFQLNAGSAANINSATGSNVIVELTLHTPESNRAKIATWDVTYPTTIAQDDNLLYTIIGKGTWNNTTAINAIKFYPGSGTFSAGTYTILELN